MLRFSGRPDNALRPVHLEPEWVRHAEGSCLVSFGDTRVLCTATLEDKVPPFLKGTGSGWITAEYGMLPRSTHTRNDREAARGRQSGRTFEIQRLIGRALRAVTDLKAMGEMQVRIDCDVLQADGGTRTAAISGAWVALVCALGQRRLVARAVRDSVGAISCGLVQGRLLLDLDYAEDSQAGMDANLVMTGSGEWVEVQCTAEKQTFGPDILAPMVALASGAIKQIHQKQLEALPLACRTSFLGR